MGIEGIDILKPDGFPQEPKVRKGEVHEVDVQEEDGTNFPIPSTPLDAGESPSIS